MGGDEKKAIKQIVKRNNNKSIMAWNRAVISDIEQSIDCLLYTSPSPRD